MLIKLDSDSLKRWAYFSFFLVIASVASSISLFEITSAIFIGLCFFSACRGNRWGMDRRALFLIGLYFLMHVISLTQSQYLSTSLRGVFKVVKQAAMFFSVVYAVDSKEKARRVFFCFLWIAFLVSLDAVWQGVSGHDLLAHREMTPYYGSVGRLTGPFRHANDFSAYLSFVIFLFLGVCMSGFRVFSKKTWALTTMGFLFVFGCLIGTYARGAWMAVVAAWVVSAVVRKSKVFLAMIVLLSLWTAFLAPPLIRFRLFSLWDSKNGTVTERRELWSESIHMIKKSPWFGLGSNTYAKNEPLFKTSNTDSQYAHNGYLQIAAEIGIPGLLNLLAFLGFFFVSTTRSFIRTSDLFLKTIGFSLLSGTLAFLIHSAVETNLQSLLLVSLLWMGMGLAWAVKLLSDRLPEAL